MLISKVMFVLSFILYCHIPTFVLPIRKNGQKIEKIVQYDMESSG